MVEVQSGGSKTRPAALGSTSGGRRRFLLLATGLGGLTGCVVTPGDIVNLIDSPIDTGCYDHDDPKLEVCGVGYGRAELNRVKADAWQEMPQWCWAACIQMAFRFHGYELAQDRIVRSTYGSTVNLPAFSWQIHRQLSKTWTDDKGKRFAASSRTLVDWTKGLKGSSTTGRRVHEELTDMRPLVLGLNGHAMLLVNHEAVLRRSSGRVLAIPRATVVDPWPFRLATSKFKTIYAADVMMTNFLATVDVEAA